MFNCLCKTVLNGEKHITSRSPTPIHKLGFLQNPFLSLKYYVSSTSNQQPFAVSYLINSLGFTPEAALSASKYVHFETPEKADAVVKFLNNHGFSQTQISNLVRRRPGLLKCNPEKTLLPKMEFFSSKGIPSPDLAKMFTGFPDLFRRSLEKQIIPSFDLFKSLLQSEDKTLQAIQRCSGMFTYYLETYVVPNINTLRESGMPESFIISILQKQPRAFRVNPVQFREAVEEVKEMGFNPSTMKFAKAVHAVRSMSKLTWERKLNVYKKWGWTEDEVSMAFRSHPWCMTVSEEKLTRVMDFLVNKMGMESSLIKKHSVLFSLSLEKRLIPRGLVLQVLLSKGLVKKNFKMHVYFECPEKTFLQKFVMLHEEEASELLKLYKGSLDSSK
ncbi:uncharacterized protein LOC112020618 [Quercus suber]|uniref:uncharacterized protein LOC112020618 n=1 Tax=Quercus suber TaxID=58331 RepID=UPI000D28B683|nr:transcription termination factor mterf6, chloroplastic/mitochondrial [Quercus suber]